MDDKLSLLGLPGEIQNRIFEFKVPDELIHYDSRVTPLPSAVTTRKHTLCTRDETGQLAEVNQLKYVNRYFYQSFAGYELKIAKSIRFSDRDSFSQFVGTLAKPKIRWLRNATFAHNQTTCATGCTPKTNAPHVLRTIDQLAGVASFCKSNPHVTIKVIVHNWCYPEIPEFCPSIGEHFPVPARRFLYTGIGLYCLSSPRPGFPRSDIGVYSDNMHQFCRLFIPPWDLYLEKDPQVVINNLRLYPHLDLAQISLEEKCKVILENIEPAYLRMKPPGFRDRFETHLLRWMRDGIPASGS